MGRVGASHRVAESIAALIDAVSELELERDAGALVDEASWPDGVDRLVAFLNAGPQFDAIDAARRERDRDRTDEALIEAAVAFDSTAPPAMLRNGSAASRIDALPERLRERARELLPARRAAVRARAVALRPRPTTRL